MKKLKYKLREKITNIISSVILWCEGRGCFRVSSQYRFPVSERIFLDITKMTGFSFSYHVTLKYDSVVTIDTILDYNLFRKDIPINRAYTLRGTKINESFDNVTPLKELLGNMKKGLRQ